ncbi:MAG: tetratricopeptide repeat protein [Treponema sp.]|jgi:tetratricopeptide (TPR) repeat protein|nr:tetratricopeptide repeat protein [Treponema sp.]
MSSIDPEDLLFRAEAAVKDGNLQEGLDIFTQVTETAPGIPAAYYYIGNIQYTLGNYEDAAAAYTRIIELDDQYAPAYNNLGVVYVALHEHTKALHLLQQGLELAPENPILLFNYGAVLDTRGRYKESIEIYQKAVNYKPDWYEALHNLGIVLCERDQHERALEIFMELLEKEPGNHQVQNNIGVVFLDQGRAQEAVQYFKQALETAPAYKIAAINLKQALQEVPTGSNRDLKQAFDSAAMLLITDQPPDRVPRTNPEGQGLSEEAGQEGSALFGESEPYKWDFTDLTKAEVLPLLKYLLCLIEYLPDQEQKKFSQSTVRSDLEHIIAILALESGE